MRLRGASRPVSPALVPRAIQTAAPPPAAASALPISVDGQLQGGVPCLRLVTLKQTLQLRDEQRQVVADLRRRRASGTGVAPFR